MMMVHERQKILALLLYYYCSSTPLAASTVFKGKFQEFKPGNLRFGVTGNVRLE
jgi:hypothetical protein